MIQECIRVVANPDEEPKQISFDQLKWGVDDDI